MRQSRLTDLQFPGSFNNIFCSVLVALFKVQIVCQVFPYWLEKCVNLVGQVLHFIVVSQTTFRLLIYHRPIVNFQFC